MQTKNFTVMSNATHHDVTFNNEGSTFVYLYFKQI